MNQPPILLSPLLTETVLLAASGVPELDDLGAKPSFPWNCLLMSGTNEVTTTIAAHVRFDGENALNPVAIDGTAVQGWSTDVHGGRQEQLILMKPWNGPVSINIVRSSGTPVGLRLTFMNVWTPMNQTVPLGTIRPQQVIAGRPADAG